jgi:hypothetical protein
VTLLPDSLPVMLHVQVTAEESLRFVGQSPIYAPLFDLGDHDKRAGSFFSTGALGECIGAQLLGNGCYWKMRPLVRVVRVCTLV